MNRKKISHKDVMNQLGVSRSTAFRILKDLKELYKCEIVTQWHFDKYLFGNFIK